MNCRVAGTNDGAGFIHKSKLNSNGSFSVGKTWTIVELRGIEVLNVSCSVRGRKEKASHQIVAAPCIQHNPGTDTSVAN